MLQNRTNQKVAVAIIYVISMLMNSIDGTVVNVALPTLAKEIGVTSAGIEAIVVGYLVSLAVFIPISGWLGDRFGHKRVFLTALAVFVTASALCGLAQTLDQLVLFRVLQGAGGGCLTPVGMALLYRTFPPQERMGVSRILMFATILGPASGPILGGLMIEHATWRWIFYVNVPIGIAALVFGILCLKESPERVDDPFDFAGFLLAGLGFGSLMYALSNGAAKGWTTPSIAIAGILGAMLLVLFVIVELRIERPMIQLRILGNRLFQRTITVSFFFTAAFLGTLFTIPLFLQLGKGVSALESGLTVFPEAIGVVVFTQVVSRIYPRVGPRRTMMGGLLWITFILLVLSTRSFDTSLWTFRALMFGLGCGMSCVFVSNQVAAMATISREETGRASTLMSVQRQVGSATGVALISSVLVLVGTETVNALGVPEPNLAAYRWAFAVAAMLAFVGAMLASRIPDADAAITMRPRSVAKPAAEPVPQPAD